MSPLKQHEYSGCTLPKSIHIQILDTHLVWSWTPTQRPAVASRSQNKEPISAFSRQGEQTLLRVPGLHLLENDIKNWIPHCL